MPEKFISFFQGLTDAGPSRCKKYRTPKRQEALLLSQQGLSRLGKSKDSIR
jgi:hypothetical protein